MHEQLRVVLEPFSKHKPSHVLSRPAQGQPVCAAPHRGTASITGKGGEPEAATPQTSSSVAIWAVLGFFRRGGTFFTLSLLFISFPLSEQQEAFLPFCSHCR